MFPMVPGHEISGVVEAVGASVKGFAVGDHVGVGCMVGSCGECSFCKEGLEQYCTSGMIGTYNSKEKYPHMAEYTAEGGGITYGGYSQAIVVDQKFVLKIPKNLDLAGAAPLLCAGITTYSPLKHFGLQAGMKLGVMGLGGLGHMAVKFGVAMGAKVTVISRGTSKKQSALADLKAHDFLDSTDDEAMKAQAGSFDFILDTISANHDIAGVMKMLGSNGKVVVVGVPTEPWSVSAMDFIWGRKSLSGSLIGGVAETQEMLDFCGAHNIVCDIELIKAADVNEAWERTTKADVKYRFVIDASTI
jgi:uncharacterized zinc-type alcohol dehydrogenase-like protein